MAPGCAAGSHSSRGVAGSAPFLRGRKGGAVQRRTARLLGMMTELSSRALIDTHTVAAWDVVCAGACRHNGAEECARQTHVVFPYRGVYVRHVGRTATI